MQLGDVVSTVTPCLMVTSDMNQLTAFGYADGFSVNTVKSLWLCQFLGPALHCRVWRGGSQSHPRTTPQLVHACSQHAATLGLHSHTHTHTPDDAAGRRRRQVVNLRERRSLPRSLRPTRALKPRMSPGSIIWHCSRTVIRCVVGWAVTVGCGVALATRHRHPTGSRPLKRWHLTKDSSESVLYLFNL